MESQTQVPTTYMIAAAGNQRCSKQYKNVLERTNSPAFLTLLNSTMSAALFKYGKLRALVSTVTLIKMVTLLKYWVQLSNSLLHMFGLNCNPRMLWLPLLPDLTFHGPI
jgi:hypothetical protein